VWGDWEGIGSGCQDSNLCVTMGLVGVGNVFGKVCRKVGKKGRKNDFEVVLGIESLSCCNWSCRGVIVIGIEVDCLK